MSSISSAGAPLFGPSGNSRIFYDKGLKHTYEEPAFLSSLGLGAFEYPAGNGITGGENAFRLPSARRRRSTASPSPFTRPISSPFREWTPKSG